MRSPAPIKNTSPSIVVRDIVVLIRAKMWTDALGWALFVLGFWLLLTPYLLLGITALLVSKLDDWFDNLQLDSLRRLCELKDDYAEKISKKYKMKKEPTHAK